jgi:primosomal protein N' (replication factor Y)
MDSVAQPQTDTANGISFAEIAVSAHVAGTFTYRVPAEMNDAISVGARVMVPFGRVQTIGYVVGLSEQNESGAEIEIKDLIELLDPEPVVILEVVELTRWVADYYAAPWGEVLKASLPSGVNASIRRVVAITPAGLEELNGIGAALLSKAEGHILQTARERFKVTRSGVNNDSVHVDAPEANGVDQQALEKALGESTAKRAISQLAARGLVRVEFIASEPTTRAKQRRMIRLAVPRHLETNGDAKPPGRAQTRVLVELEANGGELPLTDLLAIAKTSSTTIKVLEQRGLIESVWAAVRRDPLAGRSETEAEPFELSADQAAALAAIEEPLHAGQYQTFLLHGVTGSGKTEVYLRAMRHALDLGKTAMMLVPEIALTPVFSRRLRSRFGDEVAIFHSSLSPGERFDEWNRLRRGEARVVIGTRSAVFAPVRDLGLLVVDEEHDTSYRQHESPFYHARDTAIMRGRAANAVVVLGSATPSLESYANAKSGKYTYLQLPHRVGGRPLAVAETIDLREAFAEAGKPIVIAPALLTAIEETHARGEQSIILLNRRGFSSFVLCRTCGESIHCQNCDVALTYHKADRALLCHYCNFRRPAPQVCPMCQGKYIYYVGEGTQQIEAMLCARFPTLRIARLDRDTAARKNAFEHTIMKFGRGELDLLVGTQMLAKGHDYPNVTLVGVISVDAGLGMPDFRASERTFQLLTQVSGRAGRGALPGRVMVQTYYPDHYVLRHAIAQDFEGFFAEEVNHRQNLGFPPFVSLASVLVHHTDLKVVIDLANRLRAALDAANADRSCRILGPAPAPLARLKDEHRWQLLIKGRDRRKMRAVIDSAFASEKITASDHRWINLEIDPVSLM